MDNSINHKFGNLFDAPARGVALSPVERAAITLLSMGEEAASAVLRCLSREELLDVTLVMARMNGVKVDAVQDTLGNFFDAFREQSSVRGASRQFLQRSLDMALGSVIANSVLNHIYGDVIGPKMARLQWAQPQWLAERLSREHVRMQAMFLAFLPSEQASQVIHALPSESCDLVLLQIAKLKEIDHELLRDLEAVVDDCIDNLGTQSTAVEGVRQAADIINRMPGDRAQVVELLRAHDPEVVSQVEDRIYQFPILAYQNDATIAAILEQTDFELWGVALKGADPKIQGALMRAMPGRQVQAFEDMLRRTPSMPLSRVDQARREIMARLRDMAAEDEVTLQLLAEDVV
ncbi:flagellar motor switch protein FliG [Dyella sp. M7H15-1]|uniref:FliG C-terminal domain-containing protein n=1 Tax=Dyella sp. M7H15-1 TaxID=2501295 RepID=UPI001004E1AB|nr:FliG C-terminal domain-containing protein [Dyella sp. M7H15-1]QAU24300.1 flagellar motor switch protein FliG [Dyella sp. M7H15-1]